MEQPQPRSGRIFRWLRPQFSLRLLVLLVTAFAIGFPIWYRWPYEEHQLLDNGTASRVATWQRQWGGGKLQHGPQTLTMGKLTQHSNFRNGKLHGHWSETIPDRYEQHGDYVDGKKVGDWTERHFGVVKTTHWRAGRFHGTMTIKGRHGASTTATFDMGRLTHVNAKPVGDTAFSVLSRRDIDQNTAAELARFTDLDVVEMPLKDVVMYLQEKHNIVIMLDSEHLSQRDLPITFFVTYVDLHSAMTMMAAAHELAIDYRYGCLWVTTPDSAVTWTDQTGVAEITPPTGSALARAWDEPVSIDAVNVPLADVLQRSTQRLAIDIDTSELRAATDDGSPFSITLNLKGFPFRHTLGQLLYRTECRCKLDGDKLVILPPEPTPPLPAARAGGR